MMLLPLARAGRIELPTVPADCGQNAHMFYIKLRDIEDRSRLIAWLERGGDPRGIPLHSLHSCPAGEQFGEFRGEDRYTTQESERLVRLPLFYNLSVVNQRTVINSLLSSTPDMSLAKSLTVDGGIDAGQNRRRSAWSSSCWPSRLGRRALASR